MNFRPSAPTLGAEYELQIVDGRTLDLADEIHTLLSACPDRRYVTEEYFKPTVEIVSRVCANATELEQHLRDQVRMLCSAAEASGLRLAGAGTHPFSRRQVGINTEPRYLKVQAITGKASFLQVTFGLHVHVGLATGEEAIRVMGKLRPYLPLLLALSANSPYWHGLESGFSSYRQRMLMTLHAFGLPPRIPDWEAFLSLLDVSRRAGVFHDLKDIHWDLRPRPDFGTLEIRVMDAQPTAAATAMLAAVCHALVMYLGRAAPSELHLKELPEWIEQENHYRASLRGLKAQCIVDEAGTLEPMRKVAARVLTDLLPLGREIDATDQLELAMERVQRLETPADRIRRFLRRSGSMHAVVSRIAAELESEAGVHAGGRLDGLRRDPSAPSAWPGFPPQPGGGRPGTDQRRL